MERSNLAQLTSAFLLIKETLPDMKKNKWGRIINTSSVHGLIASINKSAYIASKHGIIGLTKTVALETAGTGVTVNAICPGWVLTPLVDEQIKARAKAQGISYEEAEKNLLSGSQPSKTFVTTEQLGELLAFLCSEHANQITGASIPVDGGWTAQ